MIPIWDCSIHHSRTTPWDSSRPCDRRMMERSHVGGPSPSIFCAEKCTFPTTHHARNSWHSSDNNIKTQEREPTEKLNTLVAINDKFSCIITKTELQLHYIAINISCSSFLFTEQQKENNSLRKGFFLHQNPKKITYITISTWTRHVDWIHTQIIKRSTKWSAPNNRATRNPNIDPTTNGIQGT